MGRTRINPVVHVVVKVSVVVIAVFLVYMLFFRKDYLLTSDNQITVLQDSRTDNTISSHIDHHKIIDIGENQNITLNQKRTTDCDFRVIVITFNRPKSVLRLLHSIEQADYLNDKVCLEVWIDRSKTNVIHSETFQAAKSFTFTKGTLTVHPQEKHVGIYGQWIYTWMPTSDTKEIAVILEDDLTVSKLFYRYLKAVHAKYDHKSEVNGYSLQGISIKHGGAGGRLHAPNDNIVFLYLVLGSWGFSPRRDNWIAFQQWFDTARQDKKFQPLVPGILPTGWYQSFVKQGKTDGMWTMWHIYYAFSKKERTLYPNFPGYKGLAINWKESGLHYTAGTSKADPIVTEWDPKLDNLPDEPIHLDVNGKIVKY